MTILFPIYCPDVVIIQVYGNSSAKAIGLERSFKVKFANTVEAMHNSIFAAAVALTLTNQLTRSV